MKRQLYFSIFILCFSLSAQKTLNNAKFPEDFLFGSATASYQIEGAWNVSGKGENIWDRFTHVYPELILDRSSGDIACDSYHKLREDVALLKEMGAQFYRFSLSWSRILPNGLAYKVNPDGIRYYNELIDLLLENDIIPMVTMFHWDTPQPLEDLGGFTNELMVGWFTEYAKIAIENFGDRVKLWLTFNEPKQTCLEGYGDNNKAPGYNSSGVGDYLCAHNLLKAHASVYHLYSEKYRKKQQGICNFGAQLFRLVQAAPGDILRKNLTGLMGITTDATWYEPASDTEEDREAAERKMAFNFGWYTDPIFHPDGDYPAVMKKFVAERSEKEGFSRSRLPEFTPEEIKYIKGTYDFFGLNHYTTQLVKNINEEPVGDPSFNKDARLITWHDPSWPSSSASWLKVVPWGFTKLLEWIKNRYGDVDIYITENGFADHGELEDNGRVDYYKQYLSAMLDAMYGKHKVKVKAYAAWSLLDNFEWRDGYVNRFGLHHVDMEDPNRKRTIKTSAKYYKNVIASRRVDV